MDAPPALPATDAQGQATYGMANLRSKTTGLPFVVFISQRARARHDARVKVSPGPRVQPDQMGSYQLRPFQHTDGPRLGVGDEALLRAWVALNLDVLLSYWDGRIEFTEDAIDLLSRV
ncbi:hypothetical protein Q8W71_25295 [Methylobacterium sp. NEAU 140]|uniref:hypothetical protein n=1 Tax=Methylobacterium sp. NEAU 140 TaxID=3064945 RepID=UPI00273528F6|nr:hypothetical protein [Methylobacterium sp. NEAU 140]MDP4025953.1 hypothetical protein [Methylobacterium sp. NEAU 140]